MEQDLFNWFKHHIASSVDLLEGVVIQLMKSKPNYFSYARSWSFYVKVIGIAIVC